MAGLIGAAFIVGILLIIVSIVLIRSIKSKNWFNIILGSVYMIVCIVCEIIIILEIKNKMIDDINLAEQLQFDFQLDSQICTTEEQSKRLLDLGLKIETADMKGYPSLNHEVCISCTDLDYYTYDSYPAWSLHRLICLCDVTTIAIPRGKLKDAYERQIFILETLIKTNQFNKEYLIDKL